MVYHPRRNAPTLLKLKSPVFICADDQKSASSQSQAQMMNFRGMMYETPWLS